MTKLQIEGKHAFYITIELKKEYALHLQSIMEKELVSSDKIFFERKNFKKLGFKKLEDLTVVEHFSRFLSALPPDSSRLIEFSNYSRIRKKLLRPLLIDWRNVII